MAQDLAPELLLDERGARIVADARHRVGHAHDWPRRRATWEGPAPVPRRSRSVRPGLHACLVTVRVVGRLGDISAAIEVPRVVVPVGRMRLAVLVAVRALRSLCRHGVWVAVTV